MRGGTPVNTIEGVTDGVITNSGCVGGCLQCSPRTSATSRQAAGKEREIGERYNAWQHQEFFLGGEEDAPPEEAEWISTGGNNRAKLKTTPCRHTVRARHVARLRPPILATYPARCPGRVEPSAICTQSLGMIPTLSSISRSSNISPTCTRPVAELRRQTRLLRL